MIKTLKLLLFNITEYAIVDCWMRLFVSFCVGVPECL